MELVSKENRESETLSSNPTRRSPLPPLPTATAREPKTEAEPDAATTATTTATAATATPSSGKPFYGDLCRAIAFTGIVPVSAIDVVRTGVCGDGGEETEFGFFFRSHPRHRECRNACGTVVLVAVSCGLMWASYLRRSGAISFVGFVVLVGLCSFMDLNQWPYEGESLVTIAFPSIIVGNFFNGSLTVRNHLVRMAILFGAGSFVAARSPFASFREDVLPGLGLPIACAVLFLAATRTDCLDRRALLRRLLLPRPLADDDDGGTGTAVDWNRWTVRGSRCALLSIYLYHASTELLRATEAGTSVTARAVFATVFKATVVALVGITSNGTFQKEIEANDTLERLVKERTTTIVAKNEQLHMVELALQCSETAIAITDSDANAIWMNAACEDLALLPSAPPPKRGGGGGGGNNNNNNSNPLLGRPIAEVIALETILDEQKLRGAVSGTRRTTTEDEIRIRGMTFRLEVSPYALPASAGSGNRSRSSNEAATDAGNNNNSNSNSNNSSNSRYLVVLKNVTADRAREKAEKTARDEAMLAKAMGDSMVTLTHELRTPMQGIMGVTGMLLHQKEDETAERDAVLIESLKLIMASSGLLLNLINNLLDVKKVHSEMMDEFPLSAVTAASSIRDTIDFCQPLASISGVAVVTEFGGGGGEDDRDASPFPRSPRHEYRVVSNALRLQQVLINLVSNAIKYTSEHSEIRIAIEPTVLKDVESRMDRALASSRKKKKNKNNTEDTRRRRDLPGDTPVLCFSISDSGPGIAPHQADRLFRRFARLDAQPTRVLGGSSGGGQPSGTGLGLNLCQLFVQRMHGEIWATNDHHHRRRLDSRSETAAATTTTSGRTGSTFSFYLPLVVPDATDVAASALHPIGATTEDANSLHHPLKRSSIKRTQSFEDLDLCTAQLRILLVDDVLINRKVIGRMIRQIGVEDVVVAESGEAAMDILDESYSGDSDDETIPFDLVITDLQMPGMSGSELCKAILGRSGGSSRNRHRLPVVVGLTADTSVSVAVECRASGMSEVLYKPISVVEMRDFFEVAVPKLRPGAWRDNDASHVPTTAASDTLGNNTDVGTLAGSMTAPRLGNNNNNNEDDSGKTDRRRRKSLDDGSTGTFLSKDLDRDGGGKNDAAAEPPDRRFRGRRRRRRRSLDQGGDDARTIRSRPSSRRSRNEVGPTRVGRHRRRSFDGNEAATPMSLSAQ